MNKSAFTLIELVVAIAILGIITLIAIPSVRRIQAENNDSKYVAYEKSLQASSKLFVDGYDEDLFGATNTGCAIVNYDDLKDRDLIEDIQIKNNSCSGDATCVYVRKSKNGNYHYEVHTTCREGSDIVYGTGQKCNLDLCKIEDGDGPTVDINDTSSYKDNPYYKKGQSPKLVVTIKDAGVGLKENQELTYQWYKVSGGSEIAYGDSGTIEFKNKNYAARKSVVIPNAPNLENVSDTTTYRVKLTGEIKDINNNKSSGGPWTYDVQYFVGRVLLQINMNGGYLADPHNAAYGTSDNFVTLNGSKTILSIKEGESINNLTDPASINIKKANNNIVPGSEYYGNSDGTVINFNKTGTYNQNIFCEPKYADCEYVLNINWQPNIKPATPIISNPSGGNWTNSDFSLTVSTTTAAQYIGAWYYKYDSNATLTEFNTDKSVKAEKVNNFVTAPFSRERNEKVYVRACSIYATSADDSNNCSDFANTFIRIDKTKPVFHTIKGGKYKYEPSKGGNSYTKLTSKSCKAASTVNSSLCMDWQVNYSTKKPSGTFTWPWDNIICYDAGSGCNASTERWKWIHDGNGKEWKNWSSNFDRKFYAGTNYPTYKNGYAMISDKAGNSSGVWHWRLDVKWK